MLYTRKGDGGTTKTFGCPVRISKASAVAEALGSLDEINSYLGLAKVYSARAGYSLADRSFEAIVHQVQENLFIIQAEVAGFPAPAGFDEGKIKDVEFMVDSIEKLLPPIKTFFISGGTELAAHFDVCRTLARRAERRVVAVHEAALRRDADLQAAKDGTKGKVEGKGESEGVAEDWSPEKAAEVVKVGMNTLGYLNRLSSLLYALARYSNHLAGAGEVAPTYK